MAERGKQKIKALGEFKLTKNYAGTLPKSQSGSPDKY